MKYWIKLIEKGCLSALFAAWLGVIIVALFMIYASNNDIEMMFLGEVIILIATILAILAAII